MGITYSVLCPNGTIFNQGVFVCDWWFNFDCSEAEGLYGLNDENAAEAAANSPAGGGGGAGGGAQSNYGSGRRYEGIKKMKWQDDCYQAVIKLVIVKLLIYLLVCLRVHGARSCSDCDGDCLILF